MVIRNVPSRSWRRFLNRYAASWKIDFASFRPIEESGRQVALHSRNDLLHFDSFPTRPSHGDRLLRIFTNIHPERARVWVTTDHFEALAGQFAERIGLHRKPGALDACKHLTVRAAARLGLPVVDRPPYDRFMLKIPPCHEGRRGIPGDLPQGPLGVSRRLDLDRLHRQCQPRLPERAVSPWSRPSSSGGRAWRAPRRPRSRSWRSWRGIRWRERRDPRAASGPPACATGQKKMDTSMATRVYYHFNEKARNIDHIEVAEGPTRGWPRRTS